MNRSENSLPIDFVRAPPGDGRIGLAPCPGGAYPNFGEPRDLNRDLADIAAWGAEGLVSLVQPREFEMIGVEDMRACVEAAGLWWRHLPIDDMGIPDETFEARWREEGPWLRARLGQGASFVVHCWAGLGRTGTIAARLLVELGIPDYAAIERVRTARSGSIQTRNQEAYVRACVPVSD